METRQGLINRLSEELPNMQLGLRVTANKRIFAEIEKEAIKKTAQVLIERFGARFITAIGVDAHENFEMNYAFAIDSSGTILNLRVEFPKTKPEIDSIANVSPGATWIEREIRDLLGIEFAGHPDPRRLILSDDWPEGSHPLRKSKPPTR